MGIPSKLYVQSSSVIEIIYTHLNHLPIKCLFIQTEPNEQLSIVYGGGCMLLDGTIHSLARGKRGS